VLEYVPAAAGGVACSKLAYRNN